MTNFKPHSHHNLETNSKPHFHHNLETNFKPHFHHNLDIVNIINEYKEVDVESRNHAAGG